MKTLLFVLGTLLSICAAFGQSKPQNKHQFRFFGSDGGATIQLALRPDVQRELALTDEEKTKLSELHGKLQAEVTEDFKKMQTDGMTDPNQMRGLVSASGNKFAQDLPSILTPDQYKRLRQLLIQHAGYMVMLRKDFQEELGITEDQRTQIEAAHAEQIKKLDQIRERMMSEKLSPEEMKKLSGQNMADLNTALSKVLTQEQLVKFDAMKGTPFEFDKELGS